MFHSNNLYITWQDTYLEVYPIWTNFERYTDTRLYAEAFVLCPQAWSYRQYNIDTIRVLPSSIRKHITGTHISAQSMCTVNHSLYLRKLFWIDRMGRYKEGRVWHHLTHLSLDIMDAILAADIFKCVFVNEKARILIKMSLKFVPKGRIDNNHWFRSWLGAE